MVEMKTEIDSNNLTVEDFHKLQFFTGIISVEYSIEKNKIIIEHSNEWNFDAIRELDKV